MATNSEIKEFIKLFGRLAIAECNNRIAAGKPFILPSVAMTQSALESDWGQAGIMKKANAFFGIKAGGSWTGKVYRADTWEVANGVEYNTVANFRAYDSPAESMADYYKLMTEASRYSKALCSGIDKSKWLTPRQTFEALHAAGYATDENYVTKLMNTLNGRNLDDWDDLITGEGSLPEDSKTFTKADLVQGRLTLADSGRSIALDKTNLTAVSLDLEKFFTANTYTTFTIVIPDTLTIYIAEITSTSAIISSGNNGVSYSVSAGNKVGFFLTNKDGSNLLITDIEDITITFNSGISYPEGGEINKNGIAYFVKIE